MPPKIKRKHILARHIKRHKGTNSQLCHVHTILQTAAKRNAMSPQCTQFSVAEAWLRFLWLPRCTIPSSRRLLQQIPHPKKLNSTTSAAIINHLKSIFAEHGIPESLVTDNGPQYSSREFAAFCDHWGINHITSSPLYSKSNGFIEPMVQTVKNLLKKSDAAEKIRISHFYRIEPRPLTAAYPHQLRF